jgi:predicted SAM-dependent methyltransferase
LAPGSPLLVSVPDFQSLCRMFLNDSFDLETRCLLMRAIFGTQQDEYDEHKVGLWDELLIPLLREAGFADVRRVPIFGIFRDASTLVFRNVYVSLNLIAR